MFSQEVHLYTHKGNQLVIQVIKRDGTKEPFNLDCPSIAIQKAASAAGQTINNLEEILNKIKVKFEDKESATVEEIQDVVEHLLMVSKYKDIAKKYI